MGTVAILERRVAVLEHRMNDHDDLYARLEGKVDGIADDVSVLKTDMADVKSQLGSLTGEVSVLTGRVDLLTGDVGELKAGQIEIRDMVATLLTRSENDRG